MMFQNHVPSFMDVDPAIPKREFKDLQELLSHPWIKKWENGRSDFRYCWSPNEGKWSKACLMAEWTENKKRHWWVLGYMDEIPADLPEWKS